MKTRAKALTSSQAEAKLASLLMSYARGEPWEHRHPVAALRALLLLRRLPVRVYQPSESRDGQAIRLGLQRSSLGMTTPLHEAVTMLELPRPPTRYDEGRQRATQRRHARRAVNAGVTWNRVTDPAERAYLVRSAYLRERARFGDVRFEAFESFMLRCDLWLVAWHREQPVLLSITAVDGEWALLSHFGSLASGAVASSTRYLMTGVLADELAARGVRYLCDSRSAVRLSPGVRAFSRMVGFRTGRVRVRPSGDVSTQRSSTRL